MRRSFQGWGMLFSTFYDEIHKKYTSYQPQPKGEAATKTSIVPSSSPHLRPNCSNKILVLAMIIGVKSCPHTGGDELKCMCHF